MQTLHGLLAVTLFATQAQARDETALMAPGQPVEVTMTYTMDEHCRPTNVELENAREHDLERAFSAGLAEAWKPKEEKIPLNIGGASPKALLTAEGAVCLQTDKQDCGPLKCYFAADGSLQRAVFGGREVTENGRLRDLFITRVRFSVTRN